MMVVSYIKYNKIYDNLYYEKSVKKILKIF
jgi:hypothetical protein